MSFTQQEVQSLRFLVRLVLVVGVVASMGANISFAVVVDPDAASWQIAIRAVFSALMPLGLFVCIEMVSRIPGLSKLRSGVRIVLTVAIGGFAGWVSYWHMHDILRLIGEPASTARYIPLAIDGVMAVATISMIELERIARSVAAIEHARVEQETAEMEAEIVAARVQAREASKPTAEELSARQLVGYDKLSGPAKARFTRTYRTDGSEAAIRLFRSRSRTRTPQAPAAAKVADPLHPVSPGTVDTDRLNAGMAGATA